MIPEAVAEEIDRVVGKRGRSGFLTGAAIHELKRLRMLHALKKAAGIWKNEDHPELKQGAAAWVRKLRQQDEKRFRKLINR